MPAGRSNQTNDDMGEAMPATFHYMSLQSGLTVSLHSTVMVIGFSSS